MLRKETVSESTLELLIKLMREDFLKNFFLVGGTALALQIGHRISIDIDLFSETEFDANDILSELEDKFRFQLDFQAKNTLKGSIAGVKVDFISHKYPLVKPLLEVEDVRMTSLEDIAAMKLNAIVVNGSRVKDFVDVAFLSSSFTLTQMIHAYEKKYATRNPTTAIKALGYHHDIDFNEPIILLDGKYNWKEIKKLLDKMTLNPNRRFKV